MTRTAPPFGSALIGQTEKALNAILERRLAGTGVSEPQWVTLTLANVGPSPVARADLVTRVRTATRFAERAVADRVAELAAAGLLHVDDADQVHVTDTGRARWTEIRTDLGKITADLWGDLPEADLAVAGRVLAAVLDRAHARLDG
ncbi:hypothetical protein LO762_09960 [Actinocorallia sp. API 0066]|uniref:hypothetical protein n=1 Tax=Actinocorallia sp. API 0066 TaxID=2896846 RepID=UPI001E621290|nr:hypothetical protein [Actinocorallia sp. API 0066]MCD0449514.1 hypothetical protein [Actinocorallia sp. API 0066]